MSETPYTETELLLAVMNGDRDRAAELAEGVLPGERRTLSDQLDAVDDYLRHICESCGKFAPKGLDHNPQPTDRVVVLRRPLDPDQRRRTVHHRAHAPKGRL